MISNHCKARKWCQNVQIILSESSDVSMYVYKRSVPESIISAIWIRKPWNCQKRHPNLQNPPFATSTVTEWLLLGLMPTMKPTSTDSAHKISQWVKSQWIKLGCQIINKQRFAFSRIPIQMHPIICIRIQSIADAEKDNDKVAISKKEKAELQIIEKSTEMRFSQCNPMHICIRYAYFVLSSI